MHPRSLHTIVLLVALVSRTGAQQHQPAVGPPSQLVNGSANFGHVIPGTVRDLSVDSAGRILYCTAEREVGRVETDGGRTVLADAASGPFPFELRALAETPAGDVAVLDVHGNVRVLFGASAPATLVYSDLYMIHDATDLIVDARGSFLIASATPSSGQRAVNWISDDGTRWGYYLVKHQPVQLAHDPLTGGVVIVETTAGGNLQLVQAGSSIRATVPLDTTTHPGVSVALDDGDVALEADGDVYWIAGGSIYRRSRAAGTTTLLASGFQTLRGVAIAPSSPWMGGLEAWSLYVAEGSNPTRLRELPGAGFPGVLVANDQGFVPGRGVKVNVNFGFQVFDLAADNAGRLLVGGTNFGNTHFVKRITLAGVPSIATVATSANGLAGVIEGLCVAPDDSIYALARTGTIQRITEGPLALATVFSDPANQITAGKDLALDVDGSLYVATREAWDFGKVMRVSGGGASLLTTTEEARGLAANPLGGMFVSQWRNSGFHGTVDLFLFDGNVLQTIPGFTPMNYTNDSVWGDGDICVDANGNVYTVSEDDWALVRYEPGQQGYVRIGSGYLNHPSGLAIAPSTANSGSVTGWSLYISEFDNLWEKPSVPPPAATLVDATLGFTAGRTVAGTPHPSNGRPTTLAPAAGIPGRRGGGEVLLVGTAASRVLALDPTSGSIEPVAGPADGLRGAIVALASDRQGARVLALNDDGELFVITARGTRVLPFDAEALDPRLAAGLAAPRRVASLPDPGTRRSAWYVLEGWVVWRAAVER
jgi:hypothetical protein